MAESKKRILLISQYIAPEQAIASNRWTKIAKYLKLNHNVEVTVLTNKKNYDKTSSIELSVKDDLLIKDLKYFDDYLEAEFDIITAVILPLVKKIKNNFIQKRKESNLEENREEIVVAKKQKGVINRIIHYKQVLATKIKNREKTRVIMKRITKEPFEYDVMVSTYGPLWPHIVAEKLKKKHPNVFWVADFRDPYAGNSTLKETSREMERHKRFVPKHLKEADVITRAFEGIELFESENQQVITLSNGFECEEVIPPVCPEKFNFIYTGTIYENRTDMTPVFRAIMELANEKLLSLDDVAIIYAGNFSDLFIEQVRKYHLEKIAQDLGGVARKEALKLQQNAAILIYTCLYTKQDKSLWTGKAFEYMMREKPIVCVVKGDIPSPQYEAIKYLGGTCYEEYRKEETYPVMKNYILDKYKEWKFTGNVTIEQNKKYVDQFSYCNIAEKFWEILQE